MSMPVTLRPQPINSLCGKLRWQSRIAWVVSAVAAPKRSCRVAIVDIAWPTSSDIDVAPLIRWCSRYRLVASISTLSLARCALVASGGHDVVPLVALHRGQECVPCRTADRSLAKVALDIAAKCAALLRSHAGLHGLRAARWPWPMATSPTAELRQRSAVCRRIGCSELSPFATEPREVLAWALVGVIAAWAAWFRASTTAGASSGRTAGASPTVMGARPGR